MSDQQEEEVPKRAAQTVASVKKVMSMDNRANIDDTPDSTPEKSSKREEKKSNQQDDYSSHSDDSGDRSNLESSRQAKGSASKKMSKHAVLVKKKKAMTFRRNAEDSEEEAKVKEMEESCKAKFLYKQFMPLPNLSEFIGSYITVIVESQYLTNANPAIVKRHIWGNEFYSSDSDIVCILQHSGQVKLQELPPAYKGLAVYFKVAKSRSNYTSQFKNGIRSRKNTSFEGHSLKLETVKELYDLGSEQALAKLASLMPTKSREVRRKQKHTRKAVETDQEMSIVFNLSGEPVYKFNLGEFGDKRSIDLKVSQVLEKEVLYLESLATRYELSYDTSTGLYVMKEVLDPLFKDMKYLSDNKVPLPDSDVKVIFDDLKWTELIWDDKSLEIRETFKIPEINGYHWVDK